MNESTKPKVLHIVRTFDLSGRSRMIRDLCGGLAPDFQSSVVCLTGRAGFRPDDLDIVELGLPSDGFSMHGMMRLARLAGEYRAEILHAHGRGALTYAAGARLMHRRLRLLHTVHRADGDAISGRTIVREPTLKAIDVIAAVSHAAADQFAAQNGVAPDRIEVIHNGIDLERFSSQQSAMSAQGSESTNHQINESTRILGVVMNLSPDKDFATLLEAFAQILRAFPQARLRIAGHGPAEAEVKQCAVELKIEEQVDFLGLCNDIPGFLSQCEVLLHCTRTEGLGIAILEAMAAGVPVVATRVGGIPEIIENEQTGILVEPGDPAGLREAVVRVLGDTRLRVALADRGRKQVAESFSVRTMCMHYAKLYEKMLKA